MGLGSYFLGGATGLGRRLNAVRAHRGLTVAMPDGVHLATDHYAPRSRDPHPTLLLRVPYGLAGFRAVAEAYAERGFHVVLQACRGTGGSGGEFDPLSHERDDGLATLAWIRRQPWFDGRIGITGASYLGYATWAICDALPPGAAICTKVTSAEFRTVVLPGGTLNLGLLLGWLQTVEGVRRPFTLLARMLSGGVERRSWYASLRLPLVELDRRIVGRKVPFWREWLTAALEPEFWEPLDHSFRLTEATPPNHFISGWYDFMIDQLLRDYAQLVDRGQRPYLTIGPWTHVSPELQSVGIRETVAWMRAHLCGDRSMLREKPVRVFISGRNEWAEFDAFPPAPPDDQIWHLHPGGVLGQRPSRTSNPDGYRYDPRKPTPSLGGAMFAFSGAGPVDQAPLESRKDVLTYTSDPLFSDVTIMGGTRVTLYARSSNPNTDYFVRLCDVDPQGRSINLADGIVRITSGHPPAPDDILKLTIRIHAAAHCFRRDHRIRLQVSSGAHPRYARNTGTDEPLGSATTLVPADVEIFHDPAHPSTVILPVYEGERLKLD